MPITIEKPTAEAAFEALQALPASEMARLGELIAARTSAVDQSDEWSEQDIADFRRSTHALIEKRLGAEPHDYD